MKRIKPLTPRVLLEVFDEYLTTKMEVLRLKLLKLVKNMIKIDKVQEKMMDTASLGVDGLADSAKEKMAQAKKKQGLSFKNLPWSPFGKK